MSTYAKSNKSCAEMFNGSINGMKHNLLAVPFTSFCGNDSANRDFLHVSTGRTDTSQGPGLHFCRSGSCCFEVESLYDTSMALVTFCFGSVFGMVTVRMPSSTLAEI